MANFKETDKKKIAFVCQRYGLEVNGGAELYCRQIAENLSQIYDVTVYTTCAKDHMTWANEYRAGSEEINGVHVKRFRNDRQRILPDFLEIYAKIGSSQAHTDLQEIEFIEKQGPYCPGLIKGLAAEHNHYKVIFFVTYLYYTTVMGLLKDFDNAVLIPTVHDEPAVYLRLFDKVFASAKAFIWNTEEEKTFAQKRFPFLENKAGEVVGLGIQKPQGTLPPIPESIANSPYIVYAGRIEAGKGCTKLFSYFQRYKKRFPGDLKLVLLGKAAMEIPKSQDIIHLGFVSEEMKFAIMQQALLLVLFSKYESLSMVVLESMIMGRPVLVNEECEVLKGHCVRSNAGLYFGNYPEFEGALNYLQTHKEQYETMCRNGEKYVEYNYQWPVIIRKYQNIIAAIG